MGWYGQGGQHLSSAIEREQELCTSSHSHPIAERRDNGSSEASPPNLASFVAKNVGRN